ncbi:peptidoglycan-binding protein [Clostridium sp.]|uniref:peptidoglycan-binding protein n=1 Tax=Clostridium sp. TaxID=1506 RepID=UPI0039958316
MNLNEIFSLTAGSIVSGGFSFSPNAHLSGGNLDLLDSEGNIINDRYVSDGDELLILDISYTSQRVLIQYPSGTNVRQGYIYNDTNLIKYNNPYNWQNGSTSETVYLNYEGANVFGSLDPYEKATFLYKANNRYCIVYTTSKGEFTKSGYVNYAGGISNTDNNSSNSTIAAGGIVPEGFTYDNNAVISNDSLYLRDENGNIIPGREIDVGDNITVLDISYSKQLALVQYPAGGAVRQGYVTNNPNIITYYNPYNWINGSSDETVYLDSTGNSVFGSLSPYESATILYKKDGRTCVVYDTSEKGELSKCGFVDFEGLKSVPSNLTIPYINYNNVTVRQYGTSGMGKPLNIYKIGNGKKVIFAGFAIHGFEDNWPHDGYALVQIATELIKKFSDYNSQYGLGDWSIYIAQCINPDGVINGITNNGPGRCAMTTRVDMNRCFPYNFARLTNPRNYTGPTPLGAPEAVALKNIVQEINSTSSEMIVIDFHGWMNMSQGNAEIGQYFDNQFGFGHNNIYSAGFFSSWATTLKNTKAVLIEYPTSTKSYQDVLNGNYIGKTFNAIINIIKDRTTGSGSIGNTITTLSIGAKGEAVKDLQAKLAYIGYQITIDGIFGQETLNIVEDFQRQNGLYVDGIVGPQTMKKLDEKVEKEETIKPSPIPEDKVPSVDEQNEKYKNILELLGFNGSKVFENKGVGKIISLGAGINAVMNVGVESSAKKVSGKKFPTINISDGKIKSASVSVLGNLGVTINKTSLTDVSMLIGNGSIALVITKDQQLKIKLIATYKTKDGEYNFSNSIVITLTILPDVKPGGVAPAEYLSWEDLLNDVKTRKLTAKEKDMLGTSMIVLVISLVAPPLMVINASSASVFFVNAINYMKSIIAK